MRRCGSSTSTNFTQTQTHKLSLSLNGHFLIWQAWLRKFGYLSQASMQVSTMQSTETLSTAISDMQRFYGLEETGIMDPATVE